MQVRLYTGLFIKKCIILTMIALPVILSSNGLASEIIFGQDLFITTIDTTGQPGDSIRIVYDSAGIPIDTIRNDSAQPKPLFKDLSQI